MLSCAVASAVWAPAAAEEPARPAADVEELLAGLDSDRFAVRERSERELVQMGYPVLAAVNRAAQTGGPEVRRRARRISFEIEHRALLQEFSRLAAQTDDLGIDLEQGMLLIARISNPGASRAEIDRQLDALASRVRLKLGPQADPRRADPRQVVEAVRQVLFVEEGFTGKPANYDDPGNSSLERVLATHQGLPVLVSHVIVAVADRLQVPMVGLQIPGRYMVKYDGSRAPAGFPPSDIIIDPFNGRVLRVDELEEFVARTGWIFDPLKHLAPSPKRATLARMLRNLVGDFEAAGQHQRAGQASEYLWLLTRDHPEIWQ